MNKKIFENSRFTPKGDTEANWNKAIGFIPLDKEIIIYKADTEHPAARFKVGDGKTVVQELPFSGTDIKIIEQLINEKGELLIEYVDNAVASIILPEVDQTYNAESANAQSGIAVAEVMESKLDKIGGIITGDLSIQGDLDVAGTTTTKDTETVMVKDNTIVANSDGIKLLEEAGFAIKTNETEAYGIMYDPFGDGVKIGLGGFTEDGKFVYNEGQAQFLATRADNITDGNLPQWDNEKKQFVDSGEKIGDYVKFTDYATASKAGVVKNYYNQWTSGIEFLSDGSIRVKKADNSDINAKISETMPIVPKTLDFATMSSLADCKDTTIWTDNATIDGEYIKGTKQKARELLGAVGNADYATASKAGVVKVSKAHGTNIDVGGIIKTEPASRAVIDLKTNSHMPIVPATIDYATMKALSDCKDTTLWTDDEKAAACETIGALGKSDIASGKGLGIDANGRLTTLQATPDNIFARKGDCLLVPAFLENMMYYGVTGYKKVWQNNDWVESRNNQIPLSDDEQASACEWLGAVQRKPNKDNGWNRVYGMDSTGNEVVHRVANGIQANTIVIRGVNGVVMCGTPSGDNDATTKAYVDGLIAELLTRIEALEAK